MQIFQVDAFANELFQGNPAAVIPLTGWLPDAALQRIAMENNLSETAYFIPEANGYAIRWFTPAVEVDLCGHATLAAGHVLFNHLGHPGDRIVFHTRNAGDLEVLRADTPGRDAPDHVPGRLTLNFPDNHPEAVDPTPLALIFEGLHLPPGPIAKGPYDYFIVLDNQQALEALNPDFKQLATAPGRGIVVTAPGKDCDFVSRCFYPQSGIDEDPVTGSAHTMLVPYWASRLGKNRLSATQLSKRRGYLDCELRQGRVYMSGTAHTFLQGTITLPDSPQAPTITIRDAQRVIDKWITTTGIRYFSELTNMAILTEEVGEVARLMSRLYGDQSFKPSDKEKNLADELADVLWVLCCIANQTGIDLTDALQNNLAKKNIRDALRHKANEKL
ncbi:PhzF family phenazine biosynthesis isomerase [Puia sp.]|jgi:PhzF family phenazine biosynthesis protein|uniref:PhzF family phenazine biosynthesis isomerase n=1 Tax=Puia sp. TaxID=2045100 RepID=UPI002F3F3593